MIGFSVLATALAVAAPQWSTPVQISAGDRALGPELAMNSAGDAIVVWDQEVGALCPTMPANPACIHIVEVAERPSSTSAWQAPIELNRPGIGSRPRAAIDANGDAVVIWVHDIGVPRVLQATYRRGPAGEWPNPNDLSKYVLGVMNHEVVLTSGGTAYVTWREHTDAGDTARWEERVAGIWGAAINLADGVTGGPALTPDATFAATAWAQSGEIVEVDIPDFRDRRAVDPTPGTTLTGDPDLSAGLVFPATGPNGPVVEGALGPSVRVLGAARDGTNAGPRIAGSVAVWVAPNGVQSSNGNSVDGTWSVPVTLARDAAASDPEIAVESPRRNAVAVWISGAGTVEAAIRSGAAGLWQPAVTLSGSGASSARVAIDDGSNAVAVWNRTEGDRVVVESSQLTATGPLLQQLVVPKRARMRRRIVFSVRPLPWASTLAGLPVWRFGDGKSATGASVRHAYARPGRYRVTVTQADAAGGTATATAEIRIVKRARRS
jgi:PKD domain-containing protein